MVKKFIGRCGREYLRRSEVRGERGDLAWVIRVGECKGEWADVGGCRWMQVDV